MQYIARHLAEFHEIPVSLFLQVVQVPLDGSITSGVSHSSQFCFICRLAESILCSNIQVVNEDIEQSWTQKGSLGYTTNY